MTILIVHHVQKISRAEEVFLHRVASNSFEPKKLRREMAVDLENLSWHCLDKPLETAMTYALAGNLDDGTRVRRKRDWLVYMNLINYEKQTLQLREIRRILLLFKF
jgi:hypothetical protein